MYQTRRGICDSADALGVFFFQESIVLVIIPADPTQEQMMPRSDK